MLGYKIKPPPLPRCVERPRLLRLVLAHPVVVLAAPAGSGKTCLAAQLAVATGGPTAWFLADELDRGSSEIAAQMGAALGLAWADLGVPERPAFDGDMAVSLLGAALETLAGPGCVVMDDVHLLPVDALEAVLRTTVAALPPDCRLVVCTRAGVPEALVRAHADGRAVTLGFGDLAFDPDECARVCASTGSGLAELERTGGWPLAVALSARAEPSTSARPTYRLVSELADLALAETSPAVRELLVVLARVPRFPSRLVARLDRPYTCLEELGRRHPELFVRDGEWWAPREWLRDALTETTANAALVATVATALADLDEAELATQLLLTEARYEEALPSLERLAADRLRQGRGAWVRSLLASVPPSARTVSLELSAMTAAQSLNIVDAIAEDAASEPALLRLAERCAAEHPGGLLRARALVANHYRMAADARLLGVCEEALGDALTVESPEADLVGRWAPDEVPAAAEMLRYYGQALLFAPDARALGRGRRLVAAALGLLDGVGQPTTSLRAWSTYFEVLLFLRCPDDAVRSVRLAAHHMAELEHSDGAVRLAELATLEYFAGDHHSARATIERARDCGERTGSRIAFPVLAAIEVALEVEAGPFTTGHNDRFDDAGAQLAANPCLAPFAALITAEFGIVLVRQGRTELARRYLRRAQQAIGATYFAHVNGFRCRRLDGLLRIAEGSVDEGLHVLVTLQQDAREEGRDGLVELVATDIANACSGRQAGAASRRPPAPVQIRVLAPELCVEVDGERMPPPRGFPAKLLALLIASEGLLTVDAAIEGLWPGADPDVGRNRLHGVLLRLRRGLGLPAGEPISCNDDIVRLDASPRLEIDSWEFSRHAALAATHPEAAVAAVADYASDVLTVQFAYDDTLESYRRSLRRTFLRLAEAVLAERSTELEPDALAALARRVARLAPDDDRACLAAATTLARLGHRIEARQVVEETADALAELGLDPTAFGHLAGVALDDRDGTHGRVATPFQRGDR